MYTQVPIAFLAAAAVVSAAPTASTGNNLPSRTVPLTGVTHSVVASLGGALVFDPDNVVAEVGDVVEWHFLPKNHSVAQSSFAAPCVPDADAPAGGPFFSGFNFATAAGQAADVFQLVVEQADSPIWYYCSQTVGSHCQMGMAGVINQDFDSPNTLAAYKAKAAGTGVSVSPPVVQGGRVLPNPNPNGGF